MPRKRQQKVSDHTPDELEPGTRVCVVKKTTGSNVFECWDGSASFLVELPPRFRKLMWIRRGSFVLVKSYDTFPEGPTPKIHGELPPPVQLDTKAPPFRGGRSPSISIEEEGEDNSPLWENPNRE
ncbi:hypothetical protein BS47DRAFT_1344364 [Hydnum rufescens UP504]|uniref:S1-like domain-containing protein n=1 Tax=Hydnum rufescens UP504 TaxID=1448309 RepID=A0A9P6AWN5_9AGAM|nr:hypothetical protein BS47DRAFT_1344364 [Hydnum rufescens UP504]